MSRFSRPLRRGGQIAPADGEPRHRVVVVGGGFGGLPACRFLGNLPVEVTLLDRRNHHLFQPLLYQVATGILSPGQIALPLRQILKRARNVRVELTEVTGFDLDKRVVHAVRPPDAPVEIPYDSLIVAGGAGQSYFGHDELALHAPGMKTIDDALEVRRRVLGALEMAETADDPAEQQEWLTIVVVGAGPTGCELAGQIRELATRSLGQNFRSFDPASLRVLLLDGGKEPLATFGDSLSGRAAKSLEGLGVERRMGARVTGVDATGVDVGTADGGTQRIAARTVLWAAGVQASPLAKALADATGAEVDRSGRISVLPDLTIPGHPEVFAVGDMVSLNGLPGVCEVAMQGGLHAANTIVRRLSGETDDRPFTYRDLGSVAAIGRFKAICSVRGIRLSGFPAWVVWMFVHLAFLNGFGNRISTSLRWVRWLVGHRRAERVFSVAHTGGDLSTPASVLAMIEPNPFPAAPTPDTA
ncbi:MAG: NAD(P)/FAD-dependent oxidoreductase [Ilumatobacteraceae bacterium]